jgi:hypothetical protein
VIEVKGVVECDGDDLEGEEGSEYDFDGESLELIELNHKYYR